jgi:hypothetical protein
MDRIAQHARDRSERPISAAMLPFLACASWCAPACATAAKIPSWSRAVISATPSATDGASQNACTTGAARRMRHEAQPFHRMKNQDASDIASNR